MLTSAAEDCLLYAYRLFERGEELSVSALARGLRVGDSTVTAMIQKLAKQKLMIHVPRREVSLSESGEKLARKLIRRHRLIETYLHNKLGYSWDEVHDEAERIEHAVSDRFVEAIDRELDFPKFDPHGDPIPDSEGVSATRRLRKLSDMGVGDHGKVARIMDGKPDALIYLSKLGIELGTDLEVIFAPDQDEIVHVSVEGVQRTLGATVASNILVE
ncbi:MAG: metal-dependent transcriptional regulator [Calditrichaeota bacterium]|nr:metal-dependent transcriptional regulator [Calditrichota bacterium]MCB9369455.1 metal-dependent transcriptional regulator [Calditrichota bacterium]